METPSLLAQSDSPSHLLRTLRRETSPLPDLRLLDLAPVTWNLESGQHFWRDRWKIGEHSDFIGEQLKGRWLAIDLDDTLLMGSYTMKQEWGQIGNGLGGVKRFELKTDWLASAIQLIRGNPIRILSQKKHPFLANPRVEIAFRPGLVEGLNILKSAGLGIVLVTASAMERVDWLRRRFPIFSDFLNDELSRVVSAQDLAAVTLAAATDPELVSDPSSASAHTLRPRSLAAKTPWAVSRAAGIPAYDLLIDDSSITAQLFQSSGLGGRLLFIDGRYPWSGYGIHILDSAVQRLLCTKNLGSAGSVAPSALPCPSEFTVMPEGIPVPPKVEDPLYFPLLHYGDQF